MPEIDYSVAKRPKTTYDACGDGAIVSEFDDSVFIGVIDVLGSGEEAHELADVCEKFLANNCRKNLVDIVQGLHEHIRGSRGAVIGLCLFDARTGVLKYVGIGDVTARTFGTEPRRIVSRPGIVGYRTAAPREETVKLGDGDVLVLHTDGVTSRLELAGYPGLLYDDAKTIATRIIERFGRESDDALCVALRHKP